MLSQFVNLKNYAKGLLKVVCYKISIFSVLLITKLSFDIFYNEHTNNTIYFSILHYGQATVQSIILCCFVLDYMSFFIIKEAFFIKIK